MKGDALALTFTFGDADISSATKARVFAYFANSPRMIFAKEFDITSGSPISVNISSAETNLGAGAAIMTVELVDSGGDLINSSNINTVIHESNCTVPFMPSADFRDEVLDAKDDAETAASLASGYAEEANGYKNGAETAKTLAQKWASESEDVVVESGEYSAKHYAAKSSASATAAQTAQGLSEDAQEAAEAARDRAELAADQAVQIAGVEALRQNKQSRGELWFNNGAISRSGNFPLAAPFSICFTYDAPQGAWDNVVYGSAAINFFNTYTYSTNGSTFSPRGVRCGYDQASAGGSRRLFVAFGQPPTSSEVRNDAFYGVNVSLPIGRHTICFIVKSLINGGNGNIAYSVDGGAFVAMSKFTLRGSITSESAGNVGGFSAGNKGSYWGDNLSDTTKSVFAGTLSNYRVFNFDMSDANAPYTVADYQNGVDVPPSLRGGWSDAITSAATIENNNSIYTLGAGHLGEQNGTVSVSGNTVSIERTESGGNLRIIYRQSKPFPAGTSGKVSMSWDSYSGISGDSLYAIIVNNTGVVIKSQKVSNANGYIESEFTNGLGGIFFQTDTLEVGQSFSVSNIKVYFNGALLDLENYTYEDGSAKKIFDISGNGNDATISGNVKGTHDISIKRLIDHIVAQA